MKRMWILIAVVLGIALAWWVPTLNRLRVEVPVKDACREAVKSHSPSRVVGESPVREVNGETLYVMRLENGQQWGCATIDGAVVSLERVN